MLIRPAESADVDAVASLYDQLAPGGTAPRREATLSEQLTWQRILSTPGLTVLVAEDRGEVVGTVALLLMPSLTDNCSPTGLVENMVVGSPWRLAVSAGR
jgi:hypothetical protein